MDQYISGSGSFVTVKATV